MTNHLYYGDNLDVLREHIKSESVDLVYLDPPFNSNATYNVLFRGPSGDQSQAQIEAFEDTWHWNNQAERAFDEVMQGRNSDVAEMLRAMRSFLKDNDMMAYLTHMAVRLVELHRVLKPTGSIYLHCDPTASHYLKILMDAVFWRGTLSKRNCLEENKCSIPAPSGSGRSTTPSCFTQRRANYAGTSFINLTINLTSTHSILKIDSRMATSGAGASDLTELTSERRDGQPHGGD